MVARLTTENAQDLINQSVIGTDKDPDLRAEAIKYAERALSGHIPWNDTKHDREVFYWHIQGFIAGFGHGAEKVLEIVKARRPDSGT